MVKQVCYTVKLRNLLSRDKIECNKVSTTFFFFFFYQSHIYTVSAKKKKIAKVDFPKQKFKLEMPEKMYLPMNYQSQVPLLPMFLSGVQKTDQSHHLLNNQTKCRV